MMWPDRINRVLLWASLLVGAVLALLRWPAGAMITGRIAFLFIIGVLLADAYVCANLSTTEDRYLSRVTWLLPMIALVMILSRRRTAPAS